MALCSRPCKPLPKHICAVEISAYTALTCRLSCTLRSEEVTRAHLPRPRFDDYGARRKMLVVDRPKNVSKHSLLTSMIATKLWRGCDIPHRDGNVRCNVHQPSLRYVSWGACDRKRNAPSTPSITANHKPRKVNCRVRSLILSATRRQFRTQLFPAITAMLSGVALSAEEHDGGAGGRFRYSKPRIWVITIGCLSEGL